MTQSDEEVLRFIAASFPSVWALEVLIALKREGSSCTRTQLVEQLRASELVVSNALEALVAAGLVSIEADRANYLPVTEEVRRYVDRVEQLYASRPNAIRRAIVATGRSNADAFADAFKLRRERDD